MIHHCKTCKVLYAGFVARCALCNSETIAPITDKARKALEAKERLCLYCAADISNLHGAAEFCCPGHRNAARAAWRANPERHPQWAPQELRGDLTLVHDTRRVFNELQASHIPIPKRQHLGRARLNTTHLLTMLATRDEHVHNLKNQNSFASAVQFDGYTFGQYLVWREQQPWALADSVNPVLAFVLECLPGGSREDVVGPDRDNPISFDVPPRPASSHEEPTPAEPTEPAQPAAPVQPTTTPVGDAHLQLSIPELNNDGQVAGAAKTARLVELLDALEPEPAQPVLEQADEPVAPATGIACLCCICDKHFNSVFKTDICPECAR